MNIEVKNIEKLTIATVNSEEKIINYVQSTLDFIMSIKYETDCNAIIVNKDAIIENFFNLNDYLDILDKFVNYNIKFAVYGNFSEYTIKMFENFIYKKNYQKDIFFVNTEDEALKKLVFSIK